MKNKNLLILGAFGLIVALIAGIKIWRYEASHQSTDDAFIDAHIIPISAKISGQVLNIYVMDNQDIQKGDLLLDVDPVDYKVKLDEARAELAAAEAEAHKAATDAASYKMLYGKDQVSHQVYDHALAATEVAKANADLAQKKVAAAELDLSYTRITAPESGKITRKAIEIQSFVQIGQPLLAIVPKNVWVTANFKETEIGSMHSGQHVDIKIDAYPGRKFRGHVDSVQAGTGARFSLLPPENATGNFVKVVQRVPVKIFFDDPPESLPPLAPGMSVEPVVDLR